MCHCCRRRRTYLGGKTYFRAYFTTDDTNREVRRRLVLHSVRATVTSRSDRPSNHRSWYRFQIHREEGKGTVYCATSAKG
ncbi:hypothetical protein M758_UG154900 [Ceratodon purpureus]|nr:hypothetical protein M758_UG154900 [Ceratodon purpureus]